MPMNTSYAERHTDQVVAKKPRRKLDKIRITKIDAVDRPAQEHARITLLKRDDSGVDISGDKLYDWVREAVREYQNHG